MRIEILRQAEDELSEAIEYYEDITAGLGIRLKEEARHYLQWIAEHPTSPRLRSKGYRRVNFSVFPYYIAYSISNSTIWIVAIAHAKRRPEYWLDQKEI